MSEPVFEMPLSELDTDIENLDRDVSLKLAYVSVLRKRSSANIPCNMALEDDDNEFKINVIKDVGCIPTYWNSLVRGNMSLDLCNTSNQLQEIYRHIQNFTGFMSKYDPPCVEMQIPVNVQQKKYRFSVHGVNKLKLRFLISYSTDKYLSLIHI